MLARGANQGNDIVDKLRLDVNGGGLVLHGNQLLPGQNGIDRLQRIDALPGKHHVALVRRLRVADGQADGEPVHLRIRQQLRAGGAGGVLRGEDNERLRDRMADAVDRDLALFHGLEQRGLCTRGRTVQLVCQK